jgi:hypothetical protein
VSDTRGATTEAAAAETQLLAEYLRGRDVACPSCRYNLRDLAAGRCPECGQRLALHLQLAEPRQAALLTGLVGISAGAGLNGLLLVYWAIMVTFRRPGAAGADRFLAINLAGAAVQGVALFAWLRLWSRIRRLPAPARWALAAAGCGLSLLNIVLFSVYVR